MKYTKITLANSAPIWQKLVLPDAKEHFCPFPDLKSQPENQCVSAVTTVAVILFSLTQPWDIDRLGAINALSFKPACAASVFSYRGVPGWGVGEPIAARLPCRRAVCSAAAATTEGLLGGALREGLLSRAPRQA